MTAIGIVKKSKVLASAVLALVMLMASGLLTAAAASADKPSKWTQASVTAAIQAGLVPEPLQRNYSHPITREQLTLLLVQVVAAAKHGEDGSESPAPVASELAAYRASVNHLKPASLAKPNEAIKRKEAAYMTARAADALGRYTYNLKNAIKDRSAIPGWALNSVDYVVHRGLLSLSGNGKFDPDGTISIEQAIHTAWKLYKDDGVLKLSAAQRAAILQDGKKKQAATYMYSTEFPDQRQSCCDSRGDIVYGEIIQPGTPVGHALESNVSVYIDGKYVKSYTVGDFNVIDLEELKQFGFYTTEGRTPYDGKYKEITLRTNPDKRRVQHADEKVDKSDYLVGNVVYALTAGTDRFRVVDKRRPFAQVGYAHLFTTTTGQKLIPVEELTGTWYQSKTLSQLSDSYKFEGTGKWIGEATVALVDYSTPGEIHVETVEAKESANLALLNHWWAIGKRPTIAKQLLDERDYEAVRYAQKVIAELILPGMGDREKVDAITGYLSELDAEYRYEWSQSMFGGYDPLQHVAGALLDKEANRIGWYNASQLLYSLAGVDCYPPYGHELYDQESYFFESNIPVKVDGKWELVRYMF